ncbi:MAG: tetratricopeptide repeat protein, partial [Syntrophales bacterium]
MINNSTNLQTDDLKKLSHDGELYFNERNMSKAKICFEQIIAMDPLNYEALNNLGVIHFTEGHVQQAIVFFHKALELHGDYRESLENLALCYKENGDYDDAAKSFEKVLKSGDDKPETLISIIYCHLQSGEFSLAKDSLKRFIHEYGHHENVVEVQKKLVDDFRDCLNSEKYPVGKLAKFYLNEGNLTIARDLLIPALKQGSHDNELQNLKDLLIRKEKLKRLPIAIISASNLLEKDPVRKLRWGDHWFGKELAESLSAEGAVISGKEPKVLIHLHGIPINKIEEPTYNIVWIHSHPDMITPESLSLYDHIFCLSPQFLEKLQNMGREGEL